MKEVNWCCLHSGASDDEAEVEHEVRKKHFRVNEKKMYRIKAVFLG